MGGRGDSGETQIRSMVGTLPDLKYDFLEIDLEFIDAPYRDVFGRKNNKTVAETLRHARYQQLAKDVMERYPDILDKPLGEALLCLKQSGDVFYRRFLNPHGDLRYSTFRLSSPRFDCLTGVYAYFEGEALRYVGRCRDSMKKRITQGYGKIHPKNCYLDGQATNCHLNAKITETTETISLRLCVVESKPDIERMEIHLIREHRPAWNIQRA